ncbi:MAG TPA: urea carboxylase-associated family protein [Chloroflexota bacterium]|jgi:hypothetical protein
MAAQAMRLVSEVFIEQGTGTALPVLAGQHVRVLTPHGTQVADFDVFNLHQPRETLSSSRTRAAWGAHLTTGHTLFSTPPAEREIMTIVADTVQHQSSARGAVSHDVLYGRCSRDLHARRGLAHPRGCQEILADAIAAFGLGPEDVHDPFNIFMKTGLGADGRLFYEDPDTRVGDYVELRAEIDCLVAVSACPGRSSGPVGHGLGIQVYELVSG